MTYGLVLSERAIKDIAVLKKSEPQAYKKLVKLLDELLEHPTTGTGQVEPLKGNKSGLWSRRITGRHRLIYSINEIEIEVLVISAHGHYDDK